MICLFYHNNRETVRIINRYMNKYNVDFEMQSRVRKYLKYNLKNETNSDCEKIILNKLNKSLKKELLMETLGKFLKEVPFFANLTVGTLEKLVVSLKKVQMSPEEFLYNVIFLFFHSIIKIFI